LVGAVFAGLLAARAAGTAGDDDVLLAAGFAAGAFAPVVELVGVEALAVEVFAGAGGAAGAFAAAAADVPALGVGARGAGATVFLGAAGAAGAVFREEAGGVVLRVDIVKGC
jgi:hypothetical protein